MGDSIRWEDVLQIAKSSGLPVLPFVPGKYPLGWEIGDEVYFFEDLPLAIQNVATPVILEPAS